MQGARTQFFVRRVLQEMVIDDIYDEADCAPKLRVTTDELPVVLSAEQVDRLMSEKAGGDVHTSQEILSPLEGEDSEDISVGVVDDED